MLTLNEVSINLDLERLRFFVDIILTIQVLSAIVERSSHVPTSLRRKGRGGTVTGLKSIKKNVLILLQILSHFVVLLLKFRFGIFEFVS